MTHMHVSRTAISTPRSRTRPRCAGAHQSTSMTCVTSDVVVTRVKTVALTVIPMDVDRPLWEPHALERMPPTELSHMKQWLSAIAQDQAMRKRLLELKGDQAQLWIDDLNCFVSNPEIQRSAEPGLLKNTVIILRKLCEVSSLYPTCFTLSDISDISLKSGGGFGDVYQGRSKHQLLCLKVPRIYEDSDIKQLLKAHAREAILWNQLDHPNVVPFYGIFYWGTRLCLVSPWMENGDIVEYLKKKPDAHRKPLIDDIAKGLQYLHDQNIVHGDIKGRNVLIDYDHNACLADFGLSNILSNGTLGFTRTTSTVVGHTTRWASPELFDDHAHPTYGSDVWAFGCLCYEVLTGMQPFMGSRDHQVIYKLMRGELPAQLDEVRLHSDEHLDDRLRKLIKMCWSVEVGQRPCAVEAVKYLEADSSGQLSRGGPRNPLKASTLHHSRDTNYILQELCATGLGVEAIGSLVGACPDSFDKVGFNTEGPDLKRLNADWFALPKPNVKKQLDITLVHSLIHESVVCCVRFSADGKYLATGCNRTAQIYDTKTGQKTCVLVDEGAGKSGDLYIRSVCFSPDGKFLATGAEDKQIRIWDIARKRIHIVFAGHQQEIYSLDFSTDGRLIVSGSSDKTARIWDMVDGTSKVLTINDHDSLNNDAGVTSVAISPNGQYVAAGSLDTVVRIWDVATGMLVERLRGHRDSVYSVAFTPDGKGLVSGGLDKTLKYWDVSALGGGAGGGPSGALVKRSKDGKRDNKGSPCTMNFTGHKDYVLSVAVSHDGQWVVSGSKDRGVQFWDARSAIVQCILQGHDNSVVSVNLSPVESTFATGSGDRRARIWSYNPV